MKGVGYMPNKKVNLYETIRNLEGTIRYLRTAKDIYELTPQQTSELVDSLEAIKTRLEDKLGA